MTVLALQICRVSMHVVFAGAASFGISFLTSATAGDSDTHFLVARDTVDVIPNILANHWYHWVYGVETATAFARKFTLREVLRIANQP